MCLQKPLDTLHIKKHFTIKIFVLWSVLLLGKLQLIKSARLKVSKKKPWLPVGQIWHQCNYPSLLATKNSWHYSELAG